MIINNTKIQVHKLICSRRGRQSELASYHLSIHQRTPRSPPEVPAAVATARRQVGLSGTKMSSCRSFYNYFSKAFISEIL